MSFKQVMLTVLAAGAAANPLPFATDIAQHLLDQRMGAITGMAGVPSALSGFGPDTGFYVGPQPDFDCGDTMTQALLQGVACMLYYLDTTDNNRLMYVRGNPKQLEGKITSEGEWKFEADKHQRDLQWYTNEPMKVNDANTFHFRFGSDVSFSAKPAIDYKKVKFLDSIGAEDTAQGRIPAYFFGPVQYDETYDLMCVYVVAPGCD
eukprot:Clim_evm5s91 gene=Clim_evmTU5s91